VSSSFGDNTIMQSDPPDSDYTAGAIYFRQSFMLTDELDNAVEGSSFSGNTAPQIKMMGSDTTVVNVHFVGETPTPGDAIDGVTKMCKTSFTLPSAVYASTCFAGGVVSSAALSNQTCGAICVGPPAAYITCGTPTTSSSSFLAGESTCDMCKIGTFKLSVNSKDCGECPSGHFTDVIEQTVCKTCPIGYSSVSPFSSCSACLKGTGAVAGTGPCASCPAGQHNSRDDGTGFAAYDSANPTPCVRCNAGQYADQTEQSICKACPSGYFGDPGLSAVWPNNPLSSGKRLLSNCTFCSAGTYGLDIAAGSSQGSFFCTLCREGDHCPGNVSAATVCSAGFYCPLNSITNRPNGSMLPCSTPGDFCGAGLAVQGRCPAGYRCADTSTKEPCSPTTYCPEGSASETACSVGKQCPDPSQEAPCFPGFHCPAGTEVAAKCQAGYFCPFNANIGTPTGEQLPCDASDSYCGEGAMEKSAVSAGYYTYPEGGPGTLKTAQVECVAGTEFCTNGLRQSCTTCDPGNFSAMQVLCTTLKLFVLNNHP